MDLKTERNGIYRSVEGALINKDNDALQAYKLKKVKQHKMQQLEDDVSDLKNDMSEIKELLRKLINK